MKNIKIYLVAIIFLLCVSVYATDVCSKSYDSAGNMRLRAGLEIDGNITWSNPAAWYFTNENSVNSFYPGNDPQYSDSSVTYNAWTFTSQEATWACAGRWFVTMNHGPMTNDHYAVGRNKSKSMINAAGHDLTLMFSDATWAVDSTYTIDYDDFSYTTGDTSKAQYTRPAGKFCTFKVRVTDNTKGENERYYWIGDTSTGSFTHYQEYQGDNFALLPEYGRFGEYGEAVWNISSENIDVYINVSTIYDQARFGIDIVNNSDTTKYVSLAMCGTPATSDNPSGAWGHKPYAIWKAIAQDPKATEFALGGWDLTKTYGSYEMDPVFMYLKGIGTIQKALVISGKAVPDTMEMFAYRYDTTDVANDTEKSRFDNTELDDENCDTTYNLPPKSSYINDNVQELPYKNPVLADKTSSNDTAFFTDAQATFDNNGDAVKPDYLIIDKSSNMLDFDKRSDTYYYPFGYMINNIPVSMINGDFPTTHLWPKKEAGVTNPYEDTIESSHAWPYVDQFTDPLSYMAIWGQEAIAKGKTRNIVTYYGLGGKSFVNGKLEGKTFTRQSHSLLVESPAVLSYQVTKDEQGTDTLKPNSFVVKPIIVNQAYVKNIYDFYVKQIKISFPEGLNIDEDDLYDGDGNYFEKSDDPDDPDNTWFVDKNILLGKLGVYENMTIKVVADGNYSGDLTYTITVVGQDKSESTTWTQSVSRSILVPTTKTGYFYDGPGNLLGNPFKNVDTSGEETSNPFTVADVYGLDSYGFVWNSNSQEYESISDLDTLRNVPKGYWILKSVNEDEASNEYTYKFPTFTKPNDINYGDVDIDTKYYMSEVNIALAKGWNIVSNPYIYPMQWVNVYVKNKSTNKLLSMQEAISEGWVSKTLYAYEPSKVTTSPSTGYVGYSTDATLLYPNKGYWIYAYKPVQLYFSNMIYPDAKIYDDDYYTDPDKYFSFGYATDEDYGIEEEE